ncbi:MAG TPA: outer membrane beta-barrel protein [Candidatus Xenobia bacterium]|nr:outer membrane beta-barrel protein [Candidatus Xenobia bacterium]
MKRVALVLALLLVPVAVMAQEEVPKAEVGIYYENLQVAHFNTTLGAANFDRKASGFGFRGTINVNRWAAVETVLSWQPNVDITTVAGLPANVVFGATQNAEYNIFHNEYHFKATARQGDNDQVGLFVYAGPGWVHADPNAIVESTLATSAVNKFTFTFGGGIEYYPIRKFGLRVDIGDLIAFLGTVDGVEQNTTNNLVFRIGASFRW